MGPNSTDSTTNVFQGGFLVSEGGAEQWFSHVVIYGGLTEKQDEEVDNDDELEKTEDDQEANVKGDGAARLMSLGKYPLGNTAKSRHEYQRRRWPYQRPIRKAIGYQYWRSVAFSQLGPLTVATISTLWPSGT